MFTGPESVAARTQKALKHGLAMTLFLAILLGGGTAAFSLLAAGIATLSNLSPESQTVTVVSSSGNTTSQTGSQVGIGQNSATTTTSTTGTSQANSTSAYGAATATSGTGNTTSEAGWNQQVTGQGVIDRLNNQLDHMHSPVVDMVDAGGVTIGNRVQSAFGHLLAGLVKTLFVEQN